MAMTKLTLETVSTEPKFSEIVIVALLKFRGLGLIKENYIYKPWFSVYILLNVMR